MEWTINLILEILFKVLVKFNLILKKETIFNDFWKIDVESMIGMGNQANFGGIIQGFNSIKYFLLKKKNIVNDFWKLGVESMISNQANYGYDYGSN